MSKLRYTGHPFVDVGVAAITAFADKVIPEDVTDEDLERVADYIHRNYTRPPLRGHLTMAFTSNGWFIQPSFSPEQRDYWARQHLYQWQATETSETERCVFTGEAAIASSLSGSLQESRAGRAQVPLLQGDVSINFFPAGDPGLPISGVALLALQFFPLGCAKCGNGLLAVHSDNNYLTFKFAKQFLKENIRVIIQAHTTGEGKFPSVQRSLKTHLIETLLALAVEKERSRIERDQGPASLTAYKLNNGKEVGLELYHLPLEVMAFIRGAQANFREAWDQLIQRGWQLGYKGKGQQKEASDTQTQWRNRLYEDLFDLPRASHRFIRIYFLQAVSQGQSISQDKRPVLWPLVVFFLREVVRMNQTKIDKVKELGDRLADHIAATQGRRFLRDFRVAKDYTQLRQRLIYALEKAARDNHLLFNLEDYVAIFEDDSEEFHGWKLARDLITIRIIEQLYQKRASEMIEEPTEEPEDL